MLGTGVASPSPTPVVGVAARLPGVFSKRDEPGSTGCCISSSIFGFRWIGAVTNRPAARAHGADRLDHAGASPLKPLNVPCRRRTRETTLHPSEIGGIMCVRQLLNLFGRRVQLPSSGGPRIHSPEDCRLDRPSVRPRRNAIAMWESEALYERYRRARRKHVVRLYRWGWKRPPAGLRWAARLAQELRGIRARLSSVPNPRTKEAR